MNEIVVDANAAVDFIRGDATPLQRFRFGWTIFLPVHVIGELFYGVFASKQPERNLKTVEDLTKTWRTLAPTAETARTYGRLRAQYGAALSGAKLNDLWIAALCLQHNLPLLTNDRGYDAIPGLTVIHW